MKKRISIIVLTVLLVVAFSVSLVACKTRNTEFNDDAVVNFSDYNKKAANFEAIQGENYKAIDWNNTNAIDAVKTALENSGGAKQQASFIITNSDINSDPNGELEELKRVWQRTSYLQVSGKGNSYTQVVSGMMDLQTNSGALNSIIGTIIGAFGYVRRDANIDGIAYKSSGSSPSFAGDDEEITTPSGASANWKKWEKAALNSGVAVAVADNGNIAITPMANEPQPNGLDTFIMAPYVDANGNAVGWFEDSAWGSGDSYVIDPVTGERASFIGTKKPFDNKVHSRQYYPAAIYINGNHSTQEEGKRTLTQYQIDESVVDMSKSTIAKKKDYYEVKLVYKKGASEFPSFYASKIDQACRMAAGMLLADLNSSPLNMGRIQYEELEMTYQIWNEGFMKYMSRTERFSCYCDFNVFVKAGKGLGYADNTAYQVWSYSDTDTDAATLANVKK